MTEGLVLVAAVVIVVWLGADHLRGHRRGRDAHRHLERLGTTPSAPGVPTVARPGALSRQLRAAGLRIRPGTFVAVSAIAMATCGGVLWVQFPSWPLMVVISAGFVLYTPHALLRSWASLRARRFETKLVDALDFMIGALECGQNATQALTSTAKASEQPIRGAFHQIARRIEMGMAPARAVEPVAQGYEAEGTRIFTQTLVARIEAGGAMAPVLRSVNRIIRARLEMRRKLRGQLSGAQSAAFFIAIIPYLLIPIYAWRKPDWIDRLLHHPAGPQLLFFAVVLQIIGFLWIRRILRVGFA